MPGDFNNDGSVDAADYVTWRKTPGMFGGTPEGYDLWHANFGNPGLGAGGGLGASGGTVPEPSSIALLLLGLAPLAGHYRRRVASQA